MCLQFEHIERSTEYNSIHMALHLTSVLQQVVEKVTPNHLPPPPPTQMFKYL